MPTVTLIRGDGIGPEVSAATTRVVDALGVGIEWEVHEAGAEVLEEHGTPLPEHVLESILRNGTALKGPVTTPVGTGFRSCDRSSTSSPAFDPVASSQAFHRTSRPSTS